jgi:alpha-glucosidase
MRAGASARSEWWRNAVLYEIYVRSFADSNGDGVGDLQGIEERLPYLRELGVEGVWITPFYPSPGADHGYDVADYCDVDPLFGTLAGFDALLAAAHAQGLRVIVDLVPNHTSIEHPWFSEHPDYYVWTDEPNNWLSVFGGKAWTWDGEHGHYYLHLFAPEQPDLDWHNPEVVEAMQGVIRFWVDRGVDGFRIDAIDRLMKDPQLRDDPRTDQPFGLWLLEHELGRDFAHSRNWREIGNALAAIRAAAGDALLVGEVYLPARRHTVYLEHLDRTFVFELLQSGWAVDQVRAAVQAGGGSPAPAWVLSNHDFGRLPSRVGREHERAAAMLLLTLPGTAFVYQGDEIGLGIGPGHDPPFDRMGRDVLRHPMQWSGAPGGGFTNGEPWLPLVDPDERNAADQLGDPRSVLSFWRSLIALRRELDGPLETLDLAPDVFAYRRGQHLVAINFANEPRTLPAGEVLLATQPLCGGALAPGAAAVVREG